MLYIDITIGGVTRQLTWHIGEENTARTRAAHVTCVQADGDELTHILKRFDSIPIARDKNVITWFGDHAKFIAAHL